MLLLQYLRHTLEVVVTHLGVGDPRIALGSRHLTMAQEGLHRGDLSPVLQQLCGKGVTQAMTTGVYLRLCRIELERAHLAVRGGGKGEQSIKSSIDPVQAQVEQMVEAIFTPAHTDSLEALLNEPFTGAFHQAAADR